ncbi:MAG: preprotein translocase subunit YajC [Christensenellales bacterium]|jgi:preprotein translocase subunit YajC
MLTKTLTLIETAVSTGTTEAMAEQGGLAQMLSPILLMVVMFGALYFMMIRPQRKKDKQVKDMLAALKPGDRICTIGGIYGTITSIKDDTVIVAVGAQKTPLVFARWGIRSVEDAPLENDTEPAV